MNAILKFVIYAILLFIHMFGATACYFLGLIGIAIAIVGSSMFNLQMSISGIIVVVIAYGLLRFFIWLDPSYVYYEEDW